MLEPELIERIRSQNPLVHNLTNFVVANYVANGLLALGASPIMSNAPQEMGELARIVDAIVINIGTPNREQVEAMIAAGEAANRHAKPILLDPVGVGATSYRRNLVTELLSKIQFSAIRGNAGEMATLADVEWQSKGVDAGHGGGDLHAIAKSVAARYDTIAIISGEIDVLSDGQRVVEVTGGSALFPAITGSGCLHGAVCAAFMAVEKDSLSACATACAAYGVAGEMADSDGIGHGGFARALIDNLARVKAEHLNNHQIKHG